MEEQKEEQKISIRKYKTIWQEVERAREREINYYRDLKKIVKRLNYILGGLSQTKAIKENEQQLRAAEEDRESRTSQT
ncbi:MAG: hypothetical protein ACTSQE_06950 [Candidatus Heimdallarchaeaceae archaeon]